MDVLITSVVKRVIKSCPKTRVNSHPLVQKRSFFSRAKNGTPADSHPYASAAVQNNRSPGDVMYDFDQMLSRKRSWDSCMEKEKKENEKLHAEMVRLGMEVPHQHVWAPADDMMEISRRQMVLSNENVDLKMGLVHLEKDNVELKKDIVELEKDIVELEKDIVELENRVAQLDVRMAYWYWEDVDGVTQIQELARRFEETILHEAVAVNKKLRGINRRFDAFAENDVSRGPLANVLAPHGLDLSHAEIFGSLFWAGNQHVHKGALNRLDSAGTIQSLTRAMDEYYAQTIPSDPDPPKLSPAELKKKLHDILIAISKDKL